MFGKLALLSALAGLAASAPISTESHTAETFGNVSVSFWYDGAYTGSCGFTNSTKQYIASIRNTNATLDSACGKTINITDVENKHSVLAMVVDEVVDAPRSYLNVSRVTFQQITDLDAEFFNATYVFVDAPVPEWTPPAHENGHNAGAAPAASPKKQESSPQSSPKAQPKVQAPAAAPTPKQEPKQEQQQQKPTSSSQKVEQQKPTSSSKKVEQQQKYTPPTTSSSKKQEYTPKTTSSSKKQEYTPKKEAYTPKTTSKKAQQTPAKSSGGGGQFSGRGTWYTQNGNAGACGAVNSDSAYIVAVNSAQYAGGSHCGQSVRISAGGRSITARVADMCPGCPYGGLDLSTGAFQALGSLSQGVLSLSWSWA